MNRVALLLLPLFAAAAAAEDDDLPVPVKRYLEGRKLLFDDDLPSAVEMLERVVREHPESDVADDALYWAAWSRARLPDGRPRAVEAWLRLIDRYPESPWLDEAAAALPDSSRDEAVARLRKRLASNPSKVARFRAEDALAALGLADVLPALETRLASGDGEAAAALSRLGAAGAAALEGVLRDPARSPESREAALTGWSRALLTERTVPFERAGKVLAEIEKDPAMLPVRRRIHALRKSLRPEEEQEDLVEAVRRLRRQVAELKKQIEDLEKR